MNFCTSAFIWYSFCESLNISVYQWSFMQLLFRTEWMHRNSESWSATSSHSDIPPVPATETVNYQSTSAQLDFCCLKSITALNLRETHTHPSFHIKGVSVFFALCKPVLILYTWPSGTKAQLWLIETTNKERSLSPRSLRNWRWGRHGTEIAKGQGGRPVVRAHLSHRLYTCTLTHMHTDTHTCITSRVVSHHREIHLHYSLHVHRLTAVVCKNLINKFKLPESFQTTSQCCLFWDMGFYLSLLY